MPIWDGKGLARQVSSTLLSSEVTTSLLLSHHSPVYTEARELLAQQSDFSHYQKPLALVCGAYTCDFY